jgi:hypothetical protein
MTHLVSRLGVFVGLLLPLGFCVFAPVKEGFSAEVAGVTARLENSDGSATVVVHSLEQYKVKIDVDPGTGRKTLAMRVDLPRTGLNAWPAADVEVCDAQGRALSVRRSGIEWHKLSIPVAPVPATYFVQVADPLKRRVALPAEKERFVTDEATGLNLTVAKWYDGRQAALSIRFDDSHPTHLSKAIPMLREYGFRGTFMINPGGREPNSRRRSDFEDHQAQWEACAQRGDQEFANHSLHHRGAVGDERMEAEIGDASKAIWKLIPGKSKLLALNLGGGTQWETTRTLRYYLDKYHLFDASENSTGMDDARGNRVATFRRMLEQHLERGLWYRIHYHYIGEGLSSSEANFRAVLGMAKEHASELWIAGMADIHKYQTERNASKLVVAKSGAGHLTFTLSCLSEADLYDQLLTIEVTPSQSWQPGRLAVKDAQARAIAVRTGQARGRTRLRFEVAPRDATYTIEMVP